jgi:hypothetical protein
VFYGPHPISPEDLPTQPTFEPGESSIPRQIPQDRDHFTGRFFQPLIPIYILYIAIIVTLLLVVPISHFLLSKKLEDKLEKNMEILFRVVDEGNAISLKNNKEKSEKEIILNLLDKNKRIILEKLIESGGSALQSEISRMKGMTTLKTHRALKDLEKKQIVEMESYGKTNKVTLNEDIRDILLK